MVRGVGETDEEAIMSYLHTADGVISLSVTGGWFWLAAMVGFCVPYTIGYFLGRADRRRTKIDA